MESVLLVLVAFLLSCHAFRRSGDLGKGSNSQHVVLLPAAGFSLPAKANRSSQSQAYGTRDRVAPASLLEANGSNPSDSSDDENWTDDESGEAEEIRQMRQAEEIRQMRQMMMVLEENLTRRDNFDLNMEKWAAEAGVEVDDRSEKIINLCIRKIIDQERNQICKIDTPKRKPATWEQTENLIGLVSRNLTQIGRQLFNTASSYFWSALSGIWPETTEVSAFDSMSNFLRKVAEELPLTSCERACLAMCATKKSMEYTLDPKALLPAKNAAAEQIYELGVGVCHEWATLAVAFAEAMGVESRVQVGAGGNGGEVKYDFTEKAARVAFRNLDRELDKGDAESFTFPVEMPTTKMREAAAFALPALMLTNSSWATWVFALGTALSSFSVNHHYPAFQWEDEETKPKKIRIYRSDVFACFRGGGTPDCQFFVDSDS